MGLKHNIFKNFNWSLAEIDQCDFCNLLDFINYNPKKNDENTRVINGKVYKRADKNKPPGWL